jgi:tetratricopeptide (TPR) repeat protein
VPAQHTIAAERTSRRARISVKAQASGAVATTFARSTVRDPNSAERLLQAATAARVALDFAAAAALYARLEREYPRSASCHAARVSYARLLCSQLDQPVAALARFDKYLQLNPRGALLEEALSGKGRCLARLGQRAAAVAVWRELLRIEPKSLYAQEARRALAAP